MAVAVQASHRVPQGVNGLRLICDTALHRYAQPSVTQHPAAPLVT